MRIDLLFAGVCHKQQDKEAQDKSIISTKNVQVDIRRAAKIRAKEGGERRTRQKHPHN